MDRGTHAGHLCAPDLIAKVAPARAIINVPKVDCQRQRNAFNDLPPSVCHWPMAASISDQEVECSGKLQVPMDSVGR